MTKHTQPISDPLLQPEHFIARLADLMENKDGHTEHALIQAIADARELYGDKETIGIIAEAFGHAR